ncbi:MAG: bifunctional nicotinamidase/pyrazinamidase [Devosia sp.]|nr:bifunctional nicotinamidase/pyrazinamidase [Devosia sp.]
MAIALRPDDVLVVVDMQNDFLPGGSLAVAGGHEIIRPIEGLAERFDNLVMTQDWHPADHVSFASNHPGKQPFETIELDYGTQVLWPDHCVIGSQGAAFVPSLRLPGAQLVIRKGFRPGVDSYSGFREADRKTPTGLAGYLRERGLRRLFLCGLATDFCVGWTAIDARAAGFETYVVEDACRGIDNAGSLAKAWAEMAAAGVERIAARDIG